MNAEGLVNYVRNDKPLLDSVLFHLRRIRSYIDIAANHLAKNNAEWHDDTTAEDYAEWHAPANEQYPREIRDQAIRELVAHYLGEMAIHDPKTL